MSRRTTGWRSFAFATAVAAVTVVPAVPISAAPTAGHHRSTHHHVNVRHYDSSILDDVNEARDAHGLPLLTMSGRLHAVAEKWARHMARSDELAHNPKVVHRTQRRCPHETYVAENVGWQEGGDGNTMFRRYMDDPEHRANILGTPYQNVGIATVTVHRHGADRQWNVMDFANHCR